MQSKSHDIRRLRRKIQRDKVSGFPQVWSCSLWVLPLHRRHRQPPHPPSPEHVESMPQSAIVHRRRHSAAGAFFGGAGGSYLAPRDVESVVGSWWSSSARRPALVSRRLGNRRQISHLPSVFRPVDYPTELCVDCFPLRRWPNKGKLDRKELTFVVLRTCQRSRSSRALGLPGRRPLHPATSSTRHVR